MCPNRYLQCFLYIGKQKPLRIARCLKFEAHGAENGAVYRILDGVFMLCEAETTSDNDVFELAVAQNTANYSVFEPLW